MSTKPKPAEHLAAIDATAGSAVMGAVVSGTRDRDLPRGRVSLAAMPGDAPHRGPDPRPETSPRCRGLIGSRVPQRRLDVDEVIAAIRTCRDACLDGEARS